MLEVNVVGGVLSTQNDKAKKKPTGESRWLFYRRNLYLIVVFIMTFVVVIIAIVVMLSVKLIELCLDLSLKL